MVNTFPNPEKIHAVMCDDHKPIKFRPGQLFDPIKTIWVWVKN